MNKNIYNQVSTTKIVWNILHSYGFKLFAFCFLCLIGASSRAADTYIYPSDTRITLDSPSFKVKFRYYDADGNNAYWTAPPNYISMANMFAHLTVYPPAMMAMIKQRR